MGESMGQGRKNMSGGMSRLADRAGHILSPGVWLGLTRNECPQAPSRNITFDTVVRVTNSNRVQRKQGGLIDFAVEEGPDQIANTQLWRRDSEPALGFGSRNGFRFRGRKRQGEGRLLGPRGALESLVEKVFDVANNEPTGVNIPQVARSPLSIRVDAAVKIDGAGHGAQVSIQSFNESALCQQANLLDDQGRVEAFVSVTQGMPSQGRRIHSFDTHMLVVLHVAEHRRLARFTDVSHAASAA